MTREPPGLVRSVRLLARLALRRRVNRISLFTSRRKKGRAAVGRKGSRGGKVLLLVFGGLMMFQAFVMSEQILSRFSLAFSMRQDGPARTPHEELARKIGPRLHEDWPEAESARRELLSAMGGILAILSVAILFTNLGAANQDLGRVRWGTEWLFSFPIRARHLFVAKVGEYALSDIFCWVAVFPFLTTVSIRAGAGWVGVVLGALSTLSVAFVLGALRLSTETWLRKRFSLARVKNVQALCTVTGLLLLFGTFAIAMTWPVPGFLLDTFRAASGTIAGALLTVGVLPAISSAGVLVHLAGAAAITAGAVIFCSRLVRDGLVSQSGAVHRGSRGRARAPDRPARLEGALGKEVRLLLRDRNFFVQTLVTPVLIVGFQALVNRPLFGQRGGVSGAILAYGVGAYVLMFGAFSVLSVERESLWLLYTFPMKLAGYLRQKARLWAATALVYTGATLAISWRPGLPPTAVEIAAPIMALFGTIISAFLAAGIGALGTDPLEDRPNRRVGAQWVYLYMLMAANFGYSIWVPSLWTKFVMLALYSLLAVAVWQKAEERLPLLLDPTVSPPKRVTVADGIIFTLVFFVLKDVAMLLAVEAGVASTGAALIVGFVAGGFLTVLLAALTLKGGAIRRILSPDRSGGPGTGTGRGVAIGALAGAAAGVAGLGWLFVVEHVSFLRTMREAMQHLAGGLDESASIAFAALAVFAAPLFEEFLFRGLLFRGLGRVVGPRRAIFGSAVIFAVVHPPISFPAVFLLGAAAAAVYRKTGTLWAAVAAHAVYNLIVVALSTFA